MEKDVFGIMITDKGACFGTSMLSTALICVLNAKRHGKAKTAEDVRDDIIKDLEKHYHWLTKREKDGTATDADIDTAKKEITEVIKLCKKTWDK